MTIEIGVDQAKRRLEVCGMVIEGKEPVNFLTDLLEKVLKLRRLNGLDGYEGPQVFACRLERALGPLKTRANNGPNSLLV